MSRPPPSVTRAEVLRNANEVWWTASSKAVLETQWARVSAARAHAKDFIFNPGLYDSVLGLGPLARLVLLRDVFRSEIYRDAVVHQKATYRAGSWQLNISRQAYADRLFNSACLGDDSQLWIEEDSVPARLIKSSEWRRSLCTGFSTTEGTVRGLNKWFGHRYRQAIVGQSMTPELLFSTRFHGPAALNNYVNFVLTGVYAPGANASLLEDARNSSAVRSTKPSDKAYSAGLRRLLEALGESDNQGRPVVAATCAGSTTRLTQIAADIVEALSEKSANVCYLHVRRMGMAGLPRPTACTLQALVESIHLYTQGFPDLAARSIDVWPEAELKRRIAEVRAFLARTPTTIIFGGYQHSPRPYSAISDFVLDEPLSRLLRMLVHPDLGDTKMPTPVGQFRQCQFVLLGDHLPSWANTHLRHHESFPSAPIQVSEWVRRMDLFNAPVAPASRTPDGPKRPKRATGPMSQELRQLRSQFFEHLAKDAMLASDEDARAGAYLLCQLPIEGLRSLSTTPEGCSAFEHLFATYWRTCCAGWHRVLLRSMALSLTGLRYGSVAQLLDAYAKFKDEANRLRGGDGTLDIGAPEDFGRVSNEAFRQFVESAGHANLGLIEIYASGQDESLSDPTRHPTQTVTQGQDLVLWAVSAKPGITDASYSYALRSDAVRTLILSEQYTDRVQLAVLARISCELCLQAYRILCMEVPPEGRRWRAGLRWLVESIYYGINALAMEWPRSAATTLPDRSISGLRFTLGELPSNAASALGFLYFTVFKELLCNGSVTSIGREFGNGLLELELLRFFGDHKLAANPAETLRAGEQVASWAPPPLIRHTLLQIDSGVNASDRNRRGELAVLAHLLAMCRAARRAHRVELLGEALRAIHQHLGDVAREHADQQMSILKFEIDYLLMTRASEASSLPVAMLLRIQRTLRRLCVADTSSMFARSPIGHLVELHSQAASYVEKCRKDSATISPKEIERLVDVAATDICEALPPSMILPDTISLLERLAELSARTAVATVRRQPQLGLQRTAGAIALFWLLKNLASRRQRARPSDTDVRVGAKTAQWNLELSILLRTVLGEFPNWAERGGHGDRFERRATRSARSTLDTFLREQGGDKADHVVCLILESKYARHNSPSMDTLIRIEDRSAITLDLRLDPLLRCMSWLRMAELELLEFTARPTLRVMLTEERIACALEVLYRASFSLEPVTDSETGRKDRQLRHSRVRPRLADKLYPFAELLANDVLQLVAFWDFMHSYSPLAAQKLDEWLRLIRAVTQQLQQARRKWLVEDESDSAEWRNSVSLVDAAMRAAQVRFPA